ncbi:hypothetical protein V5F49_13045 [Xanthobacter sp. V3C-3]|uniref:hypothetical protein n=1 Tax=Xanthobacter lutulentifluminis TaxID=3119935 RepID=UPI00372A4EEE
MAKRTKFGTALLESLREALAWKRGDATLDTAAPSLPLGPYRGFHGVAVFSAEDEALVGHLTDISDIVGFHGATVETVEAAFRASVDDYIHAIRDAGR